MSGKISLGSSIGIDAAFAYSLVIVAVLLLPETKGKQLDVTAAREGKLAVTGR
jgi:hypothetical protein